MNYIKASLIRKKDGKIDNIQTDVQVETKGDYAIMLMVLLERFVESPEELDKIFEQAKSYIFN